MSNEEKQIKSSNWLIKGYTEQELAEMKEKAIKEAEAELRDKQIEEIKALNLLLEDVTVDKVLFTSDGEAIDVITVKAVEPTTTNQLANILYAEGYRRASDVAREVIDEVVSKAKAIFCPDCDYDVADIRYSLDWLEAELKKKYESEGNKE